MNNLKIKSEHIFLLSLTIIGMVGVQVLSSTILAKASTSYTADHWEKKSWRVQYGKVWAYLKMYKDGSNYAPSTNEDYKKHWLTQEDDHGQYHNWISSNTYKKETWALYRPLWSKDQWKVVAWVYFYKNTNSIVSDGDQWRT